MFVESWKFILFCICVEVEVIDVVDDFGFDLVFVLMIIEEIVDNVEVWWFDVYFEVEFDVVMIGCIYVFVFSVGG